jgi:pimeloyl-ACP methyl ester carboxylesterase
MPKAPRLVPRHAGDGGRAVVLVHGIFQGGAQLCAFADALHQGAPAWTIYIYDYDWTRRLEVSGAHLAVRLEDVPGEELALIGYSMGGLVARLAAADRPNDRLRTVLTVATPNNGALSTRQLVPLGQEAARTSRLIAPLTPMPGLMDLTEAGEIMRNVRARAHTPRTVAGKRYASVPALFFHHGRPWRPVHSKMGYAKTVLTALGLVRMALPHDGIVTEESTRLAPRPDDVFSEIDFAQFDGKTPARCHAPHLDAYDRDHVTVLDCPATAQVLADLLNAPDWSSLPKHPDRRFRVE